MAEKDFARGQERAGAAAIEQFRVGIADNRPTPAVRFCPQHESLGYGDIGNIDRAFQVFVTERSDANAVSSCCDIIELETAIGTAALFAKKPQSVVNKVILAPEIALLEELSCTWPATGTALIFRGRAKAMHITSKREDFMLGPYLKWAHPASLKCYSKSLYGD
jgi:hypothetical protein